MADGSEGFPLPSSLKVVPGHRGRPGRLSLLHPVRARATTERFWFYNSMHFPEPMHHFDMITAEAAYVALGAFNTRVHVLPTAKGIEHRIINGRVYIGGVAVTDPDEIAERVGEFQQRAFYYYEHWETALRPVEGQDEGADRGCAGAAQAVAARLRAARERPTPARASPPTMRCSISTRSRSRATTGCGTTTSSSCCSATAPT